MNGIIFDIKRFAVHDGPGIRTTVFFKGCPLQCAWCHNPESIDNKPTSVSKIQKLNGRDFIEEELIGYEISPDHLITELIKDQIFMEESGGGVTFSGGEPLFQYKFLIQMLQLCKQQGIHTAVDTTLFSSWAVIKEVTQYADLFLVDLKLMNDVKHWQYTGVSNKLILENIKKLADLTIKIRIRIPVIPDINNVDDNIKQSILFLKKIRSIDGIDLLPFHNTANQKYKRIERENKFSHLHSMKKEDVEDIKMLFEKAGFNVKIGG